MLQGQREARGQMQQVCSCGKWITTITHRTETDMYAIILHACQNIVHLLAAYQNRHVCNDLFT